MKKGVGGSKIVLKCLTSFMNGPFYVINKLLLSSGYGSSVEEVAVTSSPQSVPDESGESSAGHRIKHVHGSGRSATECIRDA